MRAAAARAVLVLIVAMLAGLVHADAEPSRRGQLGATVIHGSAISDNAVQDNSVMRTSLAGGKPGMSVTIRKARVPMRQGSTSSSAMRWWDFRTMLGRCR